MFKILIWNYLHIQLWTGYFVVIPQYPGWSWLYIFFFLVIKKSEEYWKSSIIILRKLQRKLPKLFLNNKGPGFEGDYFDKEWVKEVYWHLVSSSERHSASVYNEHGSQIDLDWLEWQFYNLLGMWP